MKRGDNIETLEKKIKDFEKFHKMFKGFLKEAEGKFKDL